MDFQSLKVENAHNLRIVNTPEKVGKYWSAPFQMKVDALFEQVTFVGGEINIVYDAN